MGKEHGKVQLFIHLFLCLFGAEKVAFSAEKIIFSPLFTFSAPKREDKT